MLVQSIAAYLGRASVLVELDLPSCWVLAKRDFAKAIHLAPLDTTAYLNLAYASVPVGYA